MLLCGCASLCALGAVFSTTAIFRFTPTGGPFPPAVLGELAGHAGSSLAEAQIADCGRCHGEIAAELRDSMHGQSFTDPVFQAEFRETRDKTPCAGCHAPLATEVVRDAALAASGVDCAACHVRGGSILGVRATPSGAPHEVIAVASLRESTFCAGCHDFAFPNLGSGRGIPYSTEIPQQATFSEWQAWQASAAASEGRSCGSCHMPEVERSGGRRGRSHRMADLRDAAFVASSLEVRRSVTRVGGELVVRFELRVRGAGHSVPTGDIFRLLRVRVRNARGVAERSLARRFAESWSPAGWVLRDSVDERVEPGVPRTLELRLADDPSPIRFEVDILRLDPAASARRALPESLVVIPVASGTLDPGSL